MFIIVLKIEVNFSISRVCEVVNFFIYKFLIFCFSVSSPSMLPVSQIISENIDFFCFLLSV